MTCAICASQLFTDSYAGERPAHTAGQLTRAAVELAKLWRNDKYLRKLDVRHPSLVQAENRQRIHIKVILQAVMVVADAKQSLTITGNGDVLEPHDGVIGMSCTAPVHRTHAVLRSVLHSSCMHRTYSVPCCC